MKRIKHYRLDGDTLEAVLHFDQDSGIWIEEYLDLESNPRYTPNGRLWKSVTTEGCPYADPVFQDCGTCPWLLKENPMDLIGVCDHAAFRLIPEEPLSDSAG